MPENPVKSKAAGAKLHQKKAKKGPLKLILIELFILLVFYLCGMALSYLRFWPGSVLNGQEVGLQSAGDAEAKLQENIPSLKVVTAEAGPEGKPQAKLQILGLEQLNYKASYDTASVIASQPHFLWPKLLTMDKTYSLEQTEYTYDQELVTTLARLIGGAVGEERAAELLREAISKEAEAVYLIQGGFIEEEALPDEAITDKAQTILGIYGKTAAIHIYDDLTVPLSPEELQTLVIMKDDQTFELNEEKISEIARDLAKKYPRVENHRRALFSGSGKIVYVGEKEDVFNYQFDEELTCANLREGLMAMEDVLIPAGWIREERILPREGQPGYNEDYFEPDSTIHDEPSVPGLTVNEFGPGTPADGTYIEISIDDQHLWCFEKGELIVDTDVVTGYQGLWDTPCAVFTAVNKDDDYNLLEGKQVCDYWIGFWGQGYGIHDAWRWRVKFGSDYYTFNGSHGCVNTPKDPMIQLYEKVQLGIPVIIYETSEGR